MNLAIVAEIQRRGGAATRAELLRVATRGSIDNDLATGNLVRLFPRTFCLAVDADLREIRERAALVHLGHTAALSHTTALRRWGLPAPSGHVVHAVLPISRSHRPAAGLRVHRAQLYPPVVRLHGLVTTTPAASVVASWPELRGSAQRAPALTAVRQRLTTPAELRAQADRSTRLAGRGRLLEFIGLLEAGCESELELWGYLKVFSVPGLSHARRQLPLRVRGRSYRADLAYEDELLLVELDGRAYHSSLEQRERDIARDAALATIGWQTVRFSHRRLTTDISGVRRELLAILASRRRH
ncbi:DUF559 domain-containing protein [Jatrophihabitans sp.]|uniref:endonuclease domain-containing protein n=1 Tax=Jatrophihabitans sp. TaxID=1932789 RepID=UPI0030C76EE7|nr:uncharacterized protein [Jatrophihabitans sp.]